MQTRYVQVEGAEAESPPGPTTLRVLVRPRDQNQQNYSSKMKSGIPRVILGKDFNFPFHISPKNT